MKGPEFKAVRESCGLSRAQAATLFNVDERIICGWESLPVDVPGEVAATLASIDSGFTHAVRKAVSGMKLQMSEFGKPEDIALVRYRTEEDLWTFRPDMHGLPTSAYAARLARIRAGLADLYVSTRVVPMDPPAYRAWLGSRVDTEAERSTWAVAQP